MATEPKNADHVVQQINPARLSKVRQAYGAHRRRLYQAALENRHGIVPDRGRVPSLIGRQQPEPCSREFQPPRRICFFEEQDLPALRQSCTDNRPLSSSQRQHHVAKSAEAFPQVVMEPRACSSFGSRTIKSVTAFSDGLPS